eukprot:COSAG01_NODE_1376_length_10535_cov_103.374856_1_plen_203_part_00
MQQWFARFDIAGLVVEGGGIAQIENFLPNDVAEAALEAIQALPEQSWRREESTSSGSAEAAAEAVAGQEATVELSGAVQGGTEPELGHLHRFSAAVCVEEEEEEEEEGGGTPASAAAAAAASAASAGLGRALWVARPRCLPSFTAVRFGRGDHIGCRDDRAHLGERPFLLPRVSSSVCSRGGFGWDCVPACCVARAPAPQQH